MNASRIYGNGCFSCRITMYSIQKLPIGETPKISASTKIGNGCGGTVALLVTNQKANPATAKPTIAHRNIFISYPLRISCFLLLSLPPS